MFAKIAYLLAVVLCCAVLGASMFYALREPAAEYAVSQIVPALQADNLTIDIGKIRQWETKSVTFRLRNTAQHDLSLESVHTSCGCTEWHLDKRQLATCEP